MALLTYHTWQVRRCGDMACHTWQVHAAWYSKFLRHRISEKCLSRTAHPPGLTTAPQPMQIALARSAVGTKQITILTKSAAREHPEQTPTQTENFSSATDNLKSVCPEQRIAIPQDSLLRRTPDKSRS